MLVCFYSALDLFHYDENVSNHRQGDSFPRPHSLLCRRLRLAVLIVDLILKDISRRLTMAFFGLRKWPTPVLRPMWPFIAASGLTYYLVSSLQDMGVKSETYAKDPRNPYAAQIAKEESHH